MNTIKSFLNGLDPKTVRILKIVGIVAGILLLPGIVISLVSSMWAIMTTGFSGLPTGTVVLIVAGIAVIYWKRRQIVRFVTKKVSEYNDDDTSVDHR